MHTQDEANFMACRWQKYIQKYMDLSSCSHLPKEIINIARSSGFIIIIFLIKRIGVRCYKILRFHEYRPNNIFFWPFPKHAYQNFILLLLTLLIVNLKFKCLSDSYSLDAFCCILRPTLFAKKVNRSQHRIVYIYKVYYKYI